MSSKFLGLTSTIKFPKFMLEISIGSIWYSIGDSNTCFKIENLTSWPTRRIEYKILIDRDHIPILTVPFKTISIKMVRKIKG